MEGEWKTVTARAIFFSRIPALLVVSSWLKVKDGCSGWGGRGEVGCYRNVKSTGISLLRPEKKKNIKYSGKNESVHTSPWQRCQSRGKTRQLERRHISSSNEVALEWERCSFVSQAF